MRSLATASSVPRSGGVGRLGDVAGLVFALLLGAPEADAATLLRTAYASQYEWKEDRLKSVNLEFTFDWSSGADGKRRSGRGEVVVVGETVVRRHSADLDPHHRARFDEHVDWVLARFLRPPFEQRFGGVTVAGPEEATAGRTRVSAGGSAYYLKADRIVGAELNIGTAEAPYLVPVAYESVGLGGGYAIVKERCRYGTDSTSRWSRALETRETARAPVPAAYTYRLEEPARTEELTIRFDRVEIDAAHPVVRDPQARDRLRAAWERRFVLPNDLRLEGGFRRKADRALRRAGWPDVEGRFRIWGLDQIEVVLDDRYRDQPRGRETQEACRKDLARAFGLLRGRPFDDEFAGCGFEPEGEDVIRVYGHPHALAYRLRGGVLAGHYERVAGEAGWWTYKTRADREGRAILEGLGRRCGGRNVALAFRWGRVRGQLLPKSVSALAVSSGRDAAVGVVEYALKRLQITPP